MLRIPGDPLLGKFIGAESENAEAHTSSASTSCSPLPSHAPTAPLTSPNRVYSPYRLFTFTDAFRISLYSLVLLIGTLVGLEIPLLLRILKDQVRFKDLVSQVLTFDYIGALSSAKAAHR